MKSGQEKVLIEHENYHEPTSTQLWIFFYILKAFLYFLCNKIYLYKITNQSSSLQTPIAYTDTHTILCTLHQFLKFWYSYQRCGSRSTLIHRYSFIWDMCHIIIHLLSKNGEVNFGEFFLNWEKPIFSGKIPIFSIPVHDTGSKF